MNIEKVLQALKENNMDAYYVQNKDAARQLILERIAKGSSVTFGGSKTLKECGIIDSLSNGDYVVSKKADMASIFSSDYMLSGTNAITENGILYNVDGSSNRIAAIAHGPKNVIITAGVNKLVKTLDDAILRVKHKAAPINAKGLERDTHCAKHGKCISDRLDEGCSSEDRICCNYLISQKQRVKNRITVVIVNEELGY